EALTSDGTLFEVQATTAADKAKTMCVHRDHRATLQQAAGGAITPARTTFLNPFDSLWWTKGRDEMLFGFRQRLEAYYPAPKRKWGYYCLPILHRDRLVGRFDPKLERKTGTLRLKALYLEPGVAPDDQLITDVAAALRDFAAWHDATDIVIEPSDPAAVGEKLRAAL
ncbi:MAG: winged helix DNA-binding domain-containing protein, partial [Anaerolineae bacterium]|nr:winged helix DNA-binding domain-containing protein [Anaerolineae bacterium]